MFARFGRTLLQRQHQAISRAAVAPTGRRFMGGGGHGGGFHVSAPHLNASNVMTTICWVWILWRCYEDGAVVLGLKHPWDGHGHGHGDDDHGHGGGGHYVDEGEDGPPALVEDEEEEH